MDLKVVLIHFIIESCTVPLVEWYCAANEVHFILNMWITSEFILLMMHFLIAHSVSSILHSMIIQDYFRSEWQIVEKLCDMLVFIWCILLLWIYKYTIQLNVIVCVYDPAFSNPFRFATPEWSQTFSATPTWSGMDVATPRDPKIFFIFFLTRRILYTKDFGFSKRVSFTRLFWSIVLILLVRNFFFVRG